MSVYEHVGNLHSHTSYSDGTALHAEIAQAAGEAGLDFVIVTDHNVWVDGVEGYYPVAKSSQARQKEVLLLVGEEIHDVRRQPQANHLLAYGADAELVTEASDTQALIDAVKREGGFCYLAHPYEVGSRVRQGLEPIPWVDWDVTDYAGLELWNYMSEFKGLLRGKLTAVFYAYFPSIGITGPRSAALRRWDELLSEGKRVAAIGAADAHGKTYSAGPLSREVFPYEYLFRCVNTHVLTRGPLNGQLEHDKELLYRALRTGRTWVGYDLLASTEGFRFQARSGFNEALMGEELVRTTAVNFKVQTPQRASIRLICEGKVVARSSGKTLEYTTAEPGVYRVEAYRRYRLRRRGWIFSSPIYVK